MISRAAFVNLSCIGALLLLGGCVASGPGPDPLGTGGKSGEEVGKNPDGEPYPTPKAGYGKLARSGSQPGSIIANFKFQGYLNGDKSAGVKTISLADYFDPKNKRYKLLRISVAALWCVPCGQETLAFVKEKAELEKAGVVLLQAISEGSDTKAAVLGDLDFWMKKHSSNFTSVLDPKLENLTGFFDAGAIPWNGDIDVRSMELLRSRVGFSGEAVMIDVKPMLEFVANNPATSIQ